MDGCTEQNIKLEDIFTISTRALSKKRDEEESGAVTQVVILARAGHKYIRRPVSSHPSTLYRLASHTKQPLPDTPLTMNAFVRFYLLTYFLKNS